jgi:hypothetical protein
MVEPARFARFARSFRNVWSPTVFVVRRRRRGAPFRDRVVAVRLVPVPVVFRAAVFFPVVVAAVLRARVARRRGAVDEPPEEEEESP